ncbi:hypothetical protein [Dyadobacter sp. OTU695]|uniref:hypothetical protein n=1 Tax=Dyadobacter sp. OTU695 TaxID=3043860 RepID=UPI00313E6F84
MEKLFTTRKIRLLIDSDDIDQKNKIIDTLYQWRYTCFKAANQIFTHHYVQQQLREMLYLTEGVRARLANIKKDEYGMLSTSRMNTSYQVLAQNYKGSIPMHIMSALNGNLVASFNKMSKSLASGESAMPSFRREIPIPFKGTDVKKLRSTREGAVFHFLLFDIPFKTYLGKAGYDKREILQRLATGQVKLCTSSLALDKGKIFMLAVFQTERGEHELDQDIIAEASLSLDYPIMVSVGTKRYTIGTKDEYLYKRLAIQAAIRRKKKAMAFMNQNSRRQLRKSTIENLVQSEKRYVTHKQHVYSKRLIDVCLKNKAATLLLVDQTEKEQQAKEDPFLLRNWGYYGLKQKIERKAEKAGIAVLVE